MNKMCVSTMKLSWCSVAVGLGCALLFASNADATLTFQEAGEDGCVQYIKDYRKELGIANADVVETLVANSPNTQCNKITPGVVFDDTTGEAAEILTSTQFLVGTSYSGQNTENKICEYLVQKFEDAASTLLDKKYGIDEAKTDYAKTGLLALLNKSGFKVQCGTYEGCEGENGVAVCVFKLDKDLAVDESAVRAVLEKKNLKPKIAEVTGCRDEINTFRAKGSIGLPDFTGATTFDDVKTVLDDMVCSKIVDGTELSPVVSTNGTDYSIVFQSNDKAEALTCADALKKWESGFSLLKDAYSKNEKPAQYNSSTSPYDKPDVVAFVSLMSSSAKDAKCWAMTGCTKSAFACGFKPAAVKEGTEPFTEEQWSKLRDSDAYSGVTELTPKVALLISGLVALTFFHR